MKWGGGGVGRWGGGGVVEGEVWLVHGIGREGGVLEFRIGHSYSAVYGTQLKSTKLTE